MSSLRRLLTMAPSCDPPSGCGPAPATRPDPHIRTRLPIPAPRPPSPPSKSPCPTLFCRARRIYVPSFASSAAGRGG